MRPAACRDVSGLPVLFPDFLLSPVHSPQRLGQSRAAWLLISVATTTTSQRLWSADSLVRFLPQGLRRYVARVHPHSARGYQAAQRVFESRPQLSLVAKMGER